MRLEDLLAQLDRLLGPSADWPKPLSLLNAIRLVRNGASFADAAVAARSTATRVKRACEAATPLEDVLEISEPSTDGQRAARRKLGELLVGRAAELVFEELYKSQTETSEFKLTDHHREGSDTDYRLQNGSGKPLYRINIKFHGSPFRMARDMVGLEPEDCFPLATYKIHQALEKQENEHLPYIFAIVSVLGLTGQTVGSNVDGTLVDVIALLRESPRVTGKRDLEYRAVASLTATPSPIFADLVEQIRRAPWRLISARRADNLLHEKLFERVHAMRIRGFTQKFKGAELDMHLSLSTDMTDLRDFLTALRADGQTKMASMLERGTF